MQPIDPDNTPTTARKPRVVVSMGDPRGVGPEIIVKALADRDLRQRATFVIRGLEEPLQYAADLAEIEPYWWRVQHDSPATGGALTGVVVLDYDEHREAGMPGAGRGGAEATRAGGAASFRFVDDAIGDALRAPADPLSADAIVTGPISKQSWSLAGKGRYPGHTELLAQRLKARRHAMMFVSPRLRVILATAHIALNEIRNALTIGRVYEPIDLGHQALVHMGVERPRIGVCGLNPHAGEGGLFGDEEKRLIEPAIRLAADHGIDVRGPFPADTIFRAALDGKFDLVVAMYHDQGLIPVKTLDWENAVNMTVGLPTVRTSPDHGTAFDIAGQNVAEPSSMRAALSLAVDIASERIAREQRSAVARVGAKERAG